jgi:hypothetical protein
MFREDYLRRMVEQATAVVLTILGLIKLERYPEALVDVDRALQRFMGLNLSLVTSLSAGELAAMLRWGERLDVAKVVVLAELLQAEGDIYAARHQPGEAQPRYLKSLELLLEAAFDSESYLAPIAPRVAELKKRLDFTATPPDVAEWLGEYEATVAALPADAPLE